MPERKTEPRGYLIVHQDWYENPDEPDPLLRNARVSTLNPAGFPLAGNAKILKHGYEVLEVTDVVPHAFTIEELRTVGQSCYETFEAAQDFLHELGIQQAKIGFNPVA